MCSHHISTKARHQVLLLHCSHREKPVEDVFQGVLVRGDDGRGQGEVAHLPDPTARGGDLRVRGARRRIALPRAVLDGVARIDTAAAADTPTHSGSQL